MEFTDNLKGKLEGAKTQEEAKKIIEDTKKNVEDAGVILDDAELDKAAGGYHAGYSSRYSTKFWQFCR